MNRKTFAAIATVFLGVSSSLFGYQVTGPILELTDTKIVVQKGTEKWEIARTPETKVTGELKVGAKVTINYTMTATAVEAKPVKGDKADKNAATEKATPEAKPTPAEKAKSGKK